MRAWSKATHCKVLQSNELQENKITMSFELESLQHVHKYIHIVLGTEPDMSFRPDPHASVNIS